MKWKSILTVIGVLLAGWYTMHVLSNMKKAPKKNATLNQKRLVRVFPVKLGTVQPKFEVHGHIRASETLELTSEVSGISFSEGNLLLPGSRFEKGDVLLQVDDRQAVLELKTLLSDFQNALATLLPEIKFEFPSKYNFWLAYFEACHKERLLPPLPEVDETKIKLLMSRLGVSKLYFQIKKQEVLLEKYEIRAPFHGMVTRRIVTPGAAVRPGTALAEIMNLDTLECILDVPVDRLGGLDMSSPIILTSSAWPKPLQAQTSRLGGQVHEDTRTISLYAKPDAIPEAFQFDGTFVQAKLSGKPIQNAIEIPQRLLRESGKVFLVRDDKLVEIPVLIALKTDHTAVIASGLNEKDLLVVDVLQGIAPGTPVNSELVPSIRRQEDGGKAQ